MYGIIWLKKICKLGIKKNSNLVLIIELNLKVMIKKSVVFIFLAFFTNCLLSQYSIGLKIGVTNSNMNFFFDEDKLQGLGGITQPEASVFAKAHLGKQFAITTNVSYFSKGIDFPEIESWEMNSIELSYTLNYTKEIDKIHISPFAGFSLSHLINWYEELPNGDRRERDISDPALNRQELSLPFGIELGYIFDNITVFTELKFRRPITNLIDDEPTEDFSISASNKSVGLSLGLAYRFSKKETIAE